MPSGARLRFGERIDAVTINGLLMETGGFDGSRRSARSIRQRYGLHRAEELLEFVEKFSRGGCVADVGGRQIEGAGEIVPAPSSTSRRLKRSEGCDSR